MKSIARHCDQCKRYGEVSAESNGTVACPYCPHVWGSIEDELAIFECCPVCHGRQFYTSKDFNQFLGCLIMLIGIILVPLTYGLSLPVFALLDWYLHRRVSTILNCYKCGTEFRGFQNERNFKPFKHHIGLKYDKYR